MLFLVWYACMLGIWAAIWLAINAFIFRFCLVWPEKPLVVKTKRKNPAR